jgi:hypothetical protein
MERLSPFNVKFMMMTSQSELGREVSGNDRHVLNYRANSFGAGVGSEKAPKFLAGIWPASKKFKEVSKYYF